MAAEAMIVSSSTFKNTNLFDSIVAPHLLLQTAIPTRFTAWTLTNVFHPLGNATPKKIVATAQTKQIVQVSCSLDVRT